MRSKPMQTMAAFALLCSATTAAHASDGPPEPVLDSNGDGSVDYAEMRLRRPDVTLKRFRALDRDGNGRISREELAVARTAGNPDALAIAPRVRTESNAAVNRSEGQTRTERDTDSGGELSSEELSEVLKALDTDGDGRVSFEELRSGQMRAGAKDGEAQRSRE